MELLKPASVGDVAAMRARCADAWDCRANEVRVVHAPYRLCPLGAHIDHQLGPVCAVATRHGLLAAYLPGAGAEVVADSEGYEGPVSFPLGAGMEREWDWADYGRGALHVLQQRQDLTCGGRISISGRIAEAGLSSSAAVGLAWLWSLADMNGLTFSPRELVELDRQIENDFLGLKNGILDPAAIAFAAAGKLAIIDCATVRCDLIEGTTPFEFVAVFSGLKEALVASNKFNSRVDECLAAGGELRRLLGDGRGTPQPLGKTTAEEYDGVRGRLPPLLRRRAEHFFTESERVRRGAALYAAGDAEGFGRLMTESCLSSINNYETGCEALVDLFETLAETSGVHGARFCGAGFRGCCVALVEAGRAEEVAQAAAERYLSRWPQYEHDVWALSTVPADGLLAL